MNRHLSDATAVGAPDDVAPAWDGDNEQWWDWYMSLAENDGPPILVDVPEPDPGPLPDDAAVAAELEVPYEVPPDAVESFAADGFVVLPAVVSPGAAEVLRRRLAELLGEPGPESGLRRRRRAPGRPPDDGQRRLAAVRPRHRPRTDRGEPPEPGGHRGLSHRGNGDGTAAQTRRHDRDVHCPVTHIDVERP